MTKNLTEGNPLKLILLFSLPLLAGNLFQQAYNLVDAAIVGRYLGTMALAGVGASGSVNFLVLGFCMGICAGSEFLLHRNSEPVIIQPCAPIFLLVLYRLHCFL